MHINCTICSDLFVGVDSEVVSATSCGHLFHNQCLLQWYERSLTCPQCRQKQKKGPCTRIYFSIPNTSETQEDPSALQNKIDCLNFQVKLRDTEIKNQKEDVEKFKKQTKGLREEIIKMRDKMRIHESQSYSFKDMIQSLKREIKQLMEYKLEADSLRKELQTYKGVDEILHGSVSDANEVLARAEIDQSTLSMCVSTFKKELENYKCQLIELRELLANSQKEINKLKSELKKHQDEISVLNRVNMKLKEDISYSEDEIDSLKQKNEQLQAAISSPGGNNPRDKVLQRLLQENPAPENLANQLNGSFVASPPTKGSKKSYSPPSPGLAIRKRKEDLKVSIFQKPNRVLNTETLRFTQQKSRNTETVYDGLGGHAKSDEFVFPKLDKFKKLTKKKNLSASAASAAKRLKPDPTNLKLDSFLL